MVNLSFLSQKLLLVHRRWSISAGLHASCVNLSLLASPLVQLIAASSFLTQPCIGLLCSHRLHTIQEDASGVYHLIFAYESDYNLMSFLLSNIYFLVQAFSTRPEDDLSKVFRSHGFPLIGLIGTFNRSCYLKRPCSSRLLLAPDLLLHQLVYLCSSMDF